ncbi:hypothetical protein BDP27DRAFT_1056906 [Rhodocollybia butyracea]|uniref:Uncharacterized protein n=1 Tax=Rhodocollybia butyracea TaxID=206335 RepID=A0A9P5PMR9_9AGAR|nr:hypothetical protein BDP27DRAFT_1056906 [Rhodocollybia butyracea]
MKELIFLLVIGSCYAHRSSQSTAVVIISALYPLVYNFSAYFAGLLYMSAFCIHSCSERFQQDQDHPSLIRRFFYPRCEQLSLEKLAATLVMLMSKDCFFILILNKAPIIKLKS